MSTNMTLITSVTVGSGGAASVTLPATGTIPQTYTDLQVLMSVRTAGGGAGDTVRVQFNGSSSNFTVKELSGDGSATGSSSRTDGYVGYMNAGGSTSNTFSNASLYIPNYTSSNYKSYSVDKVSEQNGTTAYAELVAGLWSNTAAITSLTFVSAGSFNIVEGSTFYLYGISNVTSTTKATGGIVSSDGTYNYHMFPYSGTFTPTQAISADVLVVAGGGGGGGDYAGGGGAGGVLGFASQSLTATGYTVTVGAGGAGGSGAANGVTGSNSQFGSLTTVSGGGYGANSGAGANGGSGGGGAGAGAAAGGTGSQGSNGGTGSDAGSGNASGGGGGGATGAGANGSTSGTIKGGNGGTGTNSVTNWGSLTNVLNATNLGVSGYLAGGGGGGTGSGSGAISSTGGSGGGGNGGNNGSTAAAPTAGVANTGSGGGGGGRYSPQNVGGAGGSGVVIIRYAI